MARIYLAPEIASGLGEDTFWTWIAREANAEFELPNKLEKGDIVLHYSTKGKPKFPGQSISLLWELYPEMALRLGVKFKKRNKLINSSLESRWATCPTHYSRAFYGKETIVLPIAVDSDLFKPVKDEEAKMALRKKLDIPQDKTVLIWSGIEHPMKGPDLRDKFEAANPNIHLLKFSRLSPISQPELADYMRASDGWLNTSRLIPLYMFEWEAFSAGLKMVDGGGVQREFNPQNPSEFVRDMGWRRSNALTTWLEFVEKCRYELRHQ